ncbi:MAG: GNAT family N-acetyltransferase [Carnobacterium sp.]|uniref:GNAT family N-acetyltransferase n=1 Tax=Carnobacterium sp. TaxID=48221 RepID=UPI002FC79F38
MHFIWTSDLTSPTYHDALQIRYTVFVGEQGVPEEMEIDELEGETDYIVGYVDDYPVATARVLPIGQDTYKIQRVAVLKHYRGKQLGKNLMLEIERYAHQNKRSYLTLGAQDHAIGFYSNLGYAIVGDGYLDAAIPHHDMKKEIISAN